MDDALGIYMIFYIERRDMFMTAAQMEFHDGWAQERPL
jgi:hypothetical protein